MRALIVTPPQPLATGNRATADRHGRGLQTLGWAVKVAEPATPEALAREVAAFAPDVLYLLHAYRTGNLWLRVPEASRIPAAVLLTGTDIHGGLDSPDEGGIIRQVLLRAAVILTQNRLTYQRLKRDRSPLFSRLRHLPPGIVLGSVPYPLRRLHGIPSEEVLFLHPAGIRPVKGNLELLHLFDAVAAKRSGFRLAFCGPVLEEEYGRRFHKELGQRPWASHLGTVPPEAIPSALRETDVIVNNSLSEGLPNALLEAVAVGRPVLARDIVGNAAVVEDGINGLLFRSADEFSAHALSLIDRPELRSRLCRPDADRFSPAEEARRLDALLRGLSPVVFPDE